MWEKNRVEKDDFISRKDVISALKALEESAPTAQHVSAIFDCEDIIKALPSVELKERTAKVSNQIFNNSNSYTVGAWMGTCECGELVSYSSKYCHMCGAKLDWSGNE